MAQTVVNELSSLFLTFTFEDEVGDDLVPSTIDWRIDNVNDPHAPVEVTSWTAVVGMASSVAIQIPGSSNNISDQDLGYENRLVTVRMDSTLSTQAYQDKEYLIQNLRATPST